MSDWNDGMIKWEKRDTLTSGQFVGGMERWDLQWDIDRLERLVEAKDKEIGALRFDVAMLKAELNSIRGKRNG